MVNKSLDGRFLAVIVTPNPYWRHVCLMSVTKVLTNSIPMDQMLLIDKNFGNEGFYLNTLQVETSDGVDT